MCESLLFLSFPTAVEVLLVRPVASIQTCTTKKTSIGALQCTCHTQLRLFPDTVSRTSTVILCEFPVTGFIADTHDCSEGTNLFIMHSHQTFFQTASGCTH